MSHARRVSPLSTRHLRAAWTRILRWTYSSLLMMKLCSQIYMRVALEQKIMQFPISPSDTCVPENKIIRTTLSRFLRNSATSPADRLYRGKTSLRGNSEGGKHGLATHISPHIHIATHGLLIAFGNARVDSSVKRCPCSDGRVFATKSKCRPVARDVLFLV